MQFQINDIVRLKQEATTQSTAGFELGDTVMKIVRFESETVAFCPWLQRGKARFHSIPVDLLEHATIEA
jgi:hypothetical protein